ncbi:MAG: hypothetical protein F4004_09410 [Acidimicrobiia bacterium]|nr:hypothetical protein [Acidimicrobiia bacterium]MYC44260.1 hypothetical protein [Acidimicrobiia bacterium]
MAVTAPAAAQDEAQVAPPEIVRIASAPVAGVYTVGWQTLGGCDPGAGTSGAAGEVTLTVEATEPPDDTPAAGELTGTPDVAVVVIRSFCVYTWSVSLVEATTDASCVVGPAPFAPNANNAINITLADPETSCAQRSRILVRLHPAVPVGIDDTDHNAVLRTRFIATARRVEDAPRRCFPRTGISKLDDNGTPDDTTDDTVSIELRVFATTADGEECRYDVTLRVPRQLTAVRGDHEHNVFENVDPRATIDFSVGVATKTIFLLQTVVGDAGDAGARYDMSRTCGRPDETDLPEPLLPLPGGKGITPIETVTTVELREGRFNITAVLADDPSAEDAFDGYSLQVLDNQGVACEATVSVSHLPEHCKPDESSLTINLARAADPTILEFTITCGADDDDDDDDEDDDDEDDDDNGGDGANDNGSDEDGGNGDESPSEDTGSAA